MKVPLYTRQVEQAPLPNAKMADVVDPNAYGVGALKQAVSATGELEKAAKQTQGLFGAIQDRAGQLLYEQDKTEATDRVAKYLKDANDWATKAKQLKGLEAKDVAKKGEEELARLESIYGNELTNPRQKQFFKNAVMDNNLKFSNSLYTHQAQELYSAGEKADLALVGQLAVGMVDANPEDFAKGKQQIRATLEGRYLSAYGKDFVEGAYLKQISGVHAERVKALAINDGERAALAYATAHKKEMDPGVFNEVTKTLRTRVQTTDERAAVRSLIRDHGYDGAMKLIQEGKITLPGLGTKDLTNVLRPFMGMTYSLGGDGKNKTDCGKLTEDVLSAMGITIGSRAADEQYLHYEKKSTLHKDASKLQPGDLVFYENKNSKTWAPTDDPNNTDPSKAYKGVTHVGIYIGGGKIVHASSSQEKVVEADMESVGTIAGFGANGGAGAGRTERLTPERQQDMINLLKAEASQDHYMKTLTKQQSLTDLRNALVGVTEPAKVTELIQNASGLEKYEKDSLLKSVLAKRDTSDKNIKGELTLKLKAGELTPAMVDSFTEFLSTDDAFDFKAKILERDLKQGDTDGRSADEKWAGDLKEAFPSTNDSATRNQLAATVAERLDRENVKGWPRYTRAQELLKENGVVNDKGKGATPAARVIIQHGQLNSTKLGYLENVYGKDLVDLALKGHTAGNPKFLGDPKAGENLEAFLYRLSQESNDPKNPGAAIINTAALRYMTDFRIPLNQASFSEIYARTAKIMANLPKGVKFDQNRLNQRLMAGEGKE